MKIGVVGPFNPSFFSEKFDSSTELPTINMHATSVNLYVRGLLDLGHEVFVFTTGIDSYTSKVINGKSLKVYLISDKYKIRGLSKIRVIRRIRKSIKKEIKDLDVLHAEWTYEFAYSIRKFRKKIPIFCSVRDWCPYILSVIKSREDKYNWFFKNILFNAVMNTKEMYFIANSDYTYNLILDKYSENKVTTIPNPLFSEKILFYRDNYPKNTVFVAVSASLNNPRKNIRILLEAFHKYLLFDNKSELVIVGGYNNEWAESANSEHLLDNVTLKGNVPYTEVFDILDESSVLIHPSLEETFGNILLEAMCRRCLCIGGENSGAVPYVLGHGKYGLLCDVNDSDSLLSAMKTASNHEVALNIIDSATEHLIDTYSERVIAQKHVDLFTNGNHNVLKKNNYE